MKKQTATRPPHPVLSRYFDSTAERQAKVDAMFDSSADFYDAVIKAMSFGSGDWYRMDALKRAGLVSGMHVLDVGAGTGAVTLPAQEIVGAEGLVVALDPSRGMLARGRANGIEQGVLGLGERIPFPDDSFDFLLMGYALRHVSDLGIAFGEYRRVLKPGGSVLLLEITAPAHRLGRFALKIYLRYLVPFVAGVLSRRAAVRRLMEYYWDTIDNCVPPEVVVEELSRAGFADAHRTRVMNVFSEYRGTKP